MSCLQNGNKLQNYTNKTWNASRLCIALITSGPFTHSFCSFNEEFLSLIKNLKQYGNENNHYCFIMRGVWTSKYNS